MEFEAAGCGVSEIVMTSSEGSSKMEVLVIVGLFVSWFALQMWILPRFGVST
jgi:hypothetical protein